MATFASHRFRALDVVLLINGCVTGRRSIGDEVGNRGRKKRVDFLRTQRLAIAPQADKEVAYSSKVKNFCPECVLDILSQGFRIEIKFPSRERASVLLLEFRFTFGVLALFVKVSRGRGILRNGANPLGMRTSGTITVVWRTWALGARDYSDLLGRRWLGWALKKAAGQGTSLG
jgi:hypothetical protein